MSGLPEPWKSFLTAVDERLPGPVLVEVLGGFVITVLYGAPRTTSDIDVVAIVPKETTRGLIELAGEGSELHRKYGLYLDRVGVANLPENYEDRLREVFAGEFANLRLLALDPYDTALAKIERNIDRDREDVLFLAEAAPLDLSILEQRYRAELRPLLGIPGREDLTLRLWIEMIEESRRRDK